MQNKVIHYQDLGLVDYAEALVQQEGLFNRTVQTKVANRKTTSPELTNNYLLFCEHPHVYTLGRSGKKNNLLINESFLKTIDATYHETGRGGDITYHGPGQLVGYPIIDLDHFFTDIHKYLRFLEEAIILTCKEYGLEAGRIDGLTGVWLDHIEQKQARKICAMGVKASRWVTMHGFAFNISTDLSYFNHIVPCGIPDKKVTSLENELQRPIKMQEVKKILTQHLANLFEVEIVNY